jgi:nicotinamidase-related amidase
MNELKLDPRRTAIVVIDLQKGIVAMAAGAPHPTPGVVANCVNLLSAGRRAGAHPVLVHVGGSLNGADLLHPVADEPMRGTAALPPDWSDLLPELGGSPTDTVIVKRQWGAFYGTDLDLQLRRGGLRQSSSAALRPSLEWKARLVMRMSGGTNWSLPRMR